MILDVYLLHYLGATYMFDVMFTVAFFKLKLHLGFPDENAFAVEDLFVVWCKMSLFKCDSITKIPENCVIELKVFLHWQPISSQAFKKIKCGKSIVQSIPQISIT